MKLQTFTTSNNRTIYSFPVQSFPQLATNIYLIDDGDRLILVDCGSGLDQSNADLLAGFDAVSEACGTTMTLGDVTDIFLTHGHMDHFGGLKFVREYNEEAPIAIHQLDLRVISNYEERRTVASRSLIAYAEAAGISEAERDDLLRMYLYAKKRYQSTSVQMTLEEESPIFDIEVFHTPGHCPGQVCLKVDDLMLTADHILGRITPHQNPEAITLNTGLGTYLQSLKKIGRVDGIRLGLPGHEGVIPNVYTRIKEIAHFHELRLDRVRDICADKPLNIAEISAALFGPTESYHKLLALEEAGAHVEYLYQRGELIAANLDEIEAEPHPVIQYFTV